MPVPTSSRAHSRLKSSRLKGPTLTLLSLVLLCSSTLLFARGPQPSARILLDDLGFEGLSQRYLINGSSMVTVHYVDATHLLFTFVAHRLIRRIPNDPPTDQDRNIDALLLELPSGRILARTEWVLHDHGQYLWDLGHGQFLLRIRNSLTVIAPLAHLASGKPFAERLFLRTNRRIVLANLSADAGLLTVETADPIPAVTVNSKSTNFGPGPDTPEIPPPTNIQLNFYRLGQPDGPRGDIVPRNAGAVLSRHPVELPVTPAGLLNVLDQGHQRWAFDFRTHAGKLTQLALFDSTCHPLAAFISPAEFIALGCHGGDSHQQLAGFNLRGDAMWEQALSGAYISPFLAYAPTAGRFAFGRVLIASIASTIDLVAPSQLISQTVDVIQNDSGKTLLHLDCTPIVRAGQNFALAPDGMSLAVLREGAIELYPLPPITPQDKTAIERAAKLAPPPTEIDVNVSDSPSPRRANSNSEITGGADVRPDLAGPQLPSQSNDSAPPSPADGPPAAPAAPDPSQSDPPVRRKPPTLYNPSAPDPNAPPQSSAPN